MKIETKYDIGQEVWVNYYSNPRKMKVSSIHISSRLIIEYYLITPTIEGHYPKDYIYPTKEACEAAIKELK